MIHMIPGLCLCWTLCRDNWWSRPFVAYDDMTGDPDLLPTTAMSRNIGLCALITGGPQCSRDLPLALIGICAIPGGPALSRGLPFAHDDLCPR